MKSFGDWLGEIGLERYAAVSENTIDFDIVRSLSEADLRELDVSLGDPEIAGHDIFEMIGQTFEINGNDL